MSYPVSLDFLEPRPLALFVYITCCKKKTKTFVSLKYLKSISLDIHILV